MSTLQIIFLASSEMPFNKISISKICEKCDMNRKSFYYHFHDKYDLVTWIFDTEFNSITSNSSYKTNWDFFSDLFKYLYENREFYRKALKIEGQNSFSEHLHQVIQSIFAINIPKITGENEHTSFFIEMLSDIGACVINRWILEKGSMPPDEFLFIMKKMLENITIYNSQQTSN